MTPAVFTFTALLLAIMLGPAGAQDLMSYIVYNRGLPLSEVFGSVQVSSDSSVWMVDAASSGATPVRLTPEEASSSLMPSWSPGKTSVVFASNRLNDDGTPTPLLDLWSIPSSGGEPTRLTASTGHDWTPAWSPDGQTIAFASTRRAPAGETDEAWRFDIYLMDADGSNQRCLFDGGLQDEDPVFSGDGQTVYFVAERPDYSFQLWQAPVDDSGGCSGAGTASTLLDASGSPISGEDPSLSPDGGTLFFSSQGQLATYDLATSQVSLLAWVEEPWIGPDAQRFCYISEGDVYTQEVTDQYGTSALRITSSGDTYFPRWAAPGPGQPAATTFVSWIEIAANLPGQYGSRWRTDLVARNKGGSDASVQLLLHTDSGTETLSVAVPSSAQAVYPDLVGLMGHTGKGALEIRSDQPLQTSARIYNEADSGTFGQYVEGMTSDDGLAAGEDAWLLQLRQLQGEYRTNLTMTNTSAQPASVRVTLLATDGEQLENYLVALEPAQLVQDPEPFRLRAGRADLGWGFARIEVIEGAGVLASASVIDSRTNDATTVPLRR